MNMPVAAAQVAKPRSSREERRKRVKRARNFFIIAVLAALVSVAGHCLPGDAPKTGVSVSASQTGNP